MIRISTALFATTVFGLTPSSRLNAAVEVCPSRDIAAQCTAGQRIAVLLLGWRAWSRRAHYVSVLLRFVPYHRMDRTIKPRDRATRAQTERYARYRRPAGGRQRPSCGARDRHLRVRVPRLSAAQPCADGTMFPFRQSVVPHLCGRNHGREPIGLGLDRFGDGLDRRVPRQAHRIVAGKHLAGLAAGPLFNAAECRVATAVTGGNTSRWSGPFVGSAWVTCAPGSSGRLPPPPRRPRPPERWSTDRSPSCRSRR